MEAFTNTVKWLAFTGVPPGAKGISWSVVCSKGPLRESSFARQTKVELERVVKDVLMRLYGVQKGCVKIAELFVSILFAPVAQRIERRFPKPCVGGSSPLGGASVFGSAFGGPFLLELSLLQGYRQKSVSAT